MKVKEISQRSDYPVKESIRLHYIDWLRVLAILGVFLFHAVHPFDLGVWHIKNNDLSLELSIILTFFDLWGMPLFFLLSGAGSYFALRKRTARQYVEERFKRLMIPYIFGSIMFMPAMLYFEWLHNTQKGILQSNFLEFVIDRNCGFSPMWFGALGYHLWFIGFLFSFSVLALPIFFWLKEETGKRIISWLAKLSEKHGGIMVFFIPLLFIQLILQPLFPLVHDWADFCFQFACFILGYILFADERFIKSIQKDRLLVFTIAIASMATLVITSFIGDPFTWSETPNIPEFYFIWTIVTIDAWSWILSILYIGIRFLNFSNSWLQYSKKAIMPFYVIHQPIIIIIAFFVVQWNTNIFIKLPIVVLGSFITSITLYELIIKQIKFLQPFFGMKTKKSTKLKI